jgi:hypothetical protein
MASTNVAITSGSYYIVIKHRNTLETWSAMPVVFGSQPVMYDFSVAGNQAYGNNQVMVENGVWAMYTGDLNGDSNIDIIDLAGYENDVINASYGYFASDANGDGNVDLLDAPILETNANNFIFSMHP